jgi:hypothetical protein
LFILGDGSIRVTAKVTLNWDLDPEKSTYTMQVFFDIRNSFKYPCEAVFGDGRGSFDFGGVPYNVYAHWTATATGHLLPLEEGFEFGDPDIMNLVSWRYFSGGSGGRGAGPGGPYLVVY